MDVQKKNTELKRHLFLSADYVHLRKIEYFSPFSAGKRKAVSVCSAEFRLLLLHATVLLVRTVEIGVSRRILDIRSAYLRNHSEFRTQQRTKYSSGLHLVSLSSQDLPVKFSLFWNKCNTF